MNTAYRTLFESHPHPMLVVDAATRRILAANDAATFLYGHTSAEFGELTDAALAGAGASPALPAGPGAVARSVHARRDGSRFAVELSAHALDWEGRPAVLLLPVDVTAGIETARASKEDELRHQAYARELERSNRALEEFASIASHDLQEPLRKIRAFGDRLAAAEAGRLDARSSDYLARMLDAATRMQKLIADLLTYSRVSTQGLAFEPVALGDIAREVTHDLQTAIQESGGRIVIDALPTVEADPLQMRQLLQNLFSNALKYRSPDRAPVVRVSARLTAEGAELNVTDNGIGFNPKYSERIFELFQRLHGRGEYSGTGIGLALCRKIAERHGGAITVRSEPDSGSTFTVLLPLRQGRDVWQ